MPQIEPVRVYVSEEEFRASRLLNGGIFVAPQTSGSPSPIVGSYVSAAEAASWENAIRIPGPGWYDANDFRLPIDALEEAIKAYIHSPSGTEAARENASPESFGAAALAAFGSRSLPQDNDSPSPVARDFADDDQPTYKVSEDADDGDTPDANVGDDKFDTAEETALVFAAAADQATVPPLSLTTNVTQKGPWAEPEQPKGFLAKARAAMNQVFSTAKTVLGSQTTQAALLAALPHGLSALAGTTATKVAVRGALAAAAGEIFPRLLERSEKTPAIKPEPAPQLA